MRECVSVRVCLRCVYSVCRVRSDATAIRSHCVYVCAYYVCIMCLCVCVMCVCVLCVLSGHPVWEAVLGYVCTHTTRAHMHAYTHSGKYKHVPACPFLHTYTQTQTETETKTETKKETETQTATRTQTQTQTQTQTHNMYTT